MTSKPFMELGPVVVGSASRDIAPDDPRGWRLGGAVAYAGLALARLGFRPRVLLGADPLAAAADELDLLRAAGAELNVIRLARGPVFDSRESDGRRVQTCLEPGDQLPVEALPGPWRGGPAWLLVPVADELPDDWASVPPGDADVALGWQGLLRELQRGGPVRRRQPGPTPLLSRADVVVVSRQDLDPATGARALVDLLRPGAFLIVTDGERGGGLWRASGSATLRGQRYRAFSAAHVVDATGAGDAFLAGFVAARLGHPLGDPGRLRVALRLAAALGSLTVEGAGLHGVPDEAAIAVRLGGSAERA